MSDIGKIAFEHDLQSRPTLEVAVSHKPHLMRFSRHTFDRQGENQQEHR
jgi:hypothetical protein